MHVPADWPDVQKTRVAVIKAYNEAPQEFYPGDRVEIVSSCPVKEIEDAKGLRGVVTHYEFDDGYECCQTLSTSTPLTCAKGAEGERGS